MGNEKTEVVETCESCLCFKEISAVAGGKCRNSPPQLPAGSRTGTGLGAWIQPVVAHDDWCAEHIDKDIHNTDFMDLSLEGDEPVVDDEGAKVTEQADADADETKVDDPKEQTEEEKLAAMMGNSPSTEEQAKAAPTKAASTKAPVKKKADAKK